MTVEPDTRLMAAGAEREFHHPATVNPGRGHRESTFVPGHDRILPGRSMLLGLLGRLEVVLDGAGPERRAGEVMAQIPVLAQAPILQVDLDAPKSIEQLIVVAAHDGTREGIEIGLRRAGILSIS